MALALLVAGLLPSCALHRRWQQHRAQQKVAATEVRPAQPVLSEWWGDELPGKPQIAIDLSTQRANIYRAGKYAGWTTVATARPGFTTPTGRFTIVEKQAQKRSNRYGVILDAQGNIVDHDAKAGRESIPAGGRFRGTSMPYWMRLTWTGIGMHQGDIPYPGHPASRGCIRLPGNVAEKLFEVAPVGTVVTIQP